MYHFINLQQAKLSRAHVPGSPNPAHDFASVLILRRLGSLVLQ